MSHGIEQVAQRAGVSTATVSRALRGLPNVAESTRERVRRAAEELDYVVSASASRLATGRTQQVGVITPYVSRWFFGQVLSGVESVLRAAGYDLLLYSVGDEDSRRRFFSTMPLRRRVDAVLDLTLPLDPTEVTALGRLKIPTVLLGSSLPGFASVRIDDTAGARLAVNHLLSLGHERIAMISGEKVSSLARFTAPADRARGYREALREAGGVPDPELEEAGDFTLVGGERAMAALLSSRRRPTAVFAQSDEMAMGALRALRRVGLRCPQDVSVIGFDDHDLAEYLDLTTIAQPVVAQGQRAAQLALDYLQDPSAPPRAEVLPVHVVIRGTTGPAPVPPRSSRSSSGTRRRAPMQSPPPSPPAGGPS